ncbi:hypothetical protein [Bradyrhizobium neotropicale]|uniref:hypothetical protein n=1 Tax=Bradyrhizobium neotropicale TaxID=1497615 RepID=UPI001AD7634F|nr:hypothetical protein [Bradyrhizobium neotropicale]MBO4228455.1 hypothetical protein [Bradyrhizobium neotropicale]
MTGKISGNDCGIAANIAIANAATTLPFITKPEETEPTYRGKGVPLPSFRD